MESWCSTCSYKLHFGKQPYNHSLSEFYQQARAARRAEPAPQSSVSSLVLLKLVRRVRRSSPTGSAFTTSKISARVPKCRPEATFKEFN